MFWTKAHSLVLLLEVNSNRYSQKNLFLQIPDATTQAIALLEVTTGPAKAAITSLNRICGRYFTTANAAAVTATVCCK